AAAADDGRGRPAAPVIHKDAPCPCPGGRNNLHPQGQASAPVRPVRYRSVRGGASHPRGAPMSLYLSPGSPYWQYDFQIRRRRFHGSTRTKDRAEAARIEKAEKVK